MSYSRAMRIQNAPTILRMDINNKLDELSDKIKRINTIHEKQYVDSLNAKTRIKLINLIISRNFFR